MSSIAPDNSLQARVVTMAVQEMPSGKGQFIRNTSFFWIGVCFFLVPSLINTYLLMPFPGSQNIEAITFCYYFTPVIVPLRIIGGVFLAIYMFKYFSALTLKNKLIRVGIILVAICTIYLTDVQFKAAKMFEEPQDIVFANAMRNKVPLSDLVIGVVHNGVAKAYPIIYLGYHHKIQDDVNGMPVMVTYCTMCRTGVVFNPVIDGKRETFRLVGARHYNAIIEDASSKTWWYQATGIAAVGPQKGKHLEEISYTQATLSNWLKRYPASLILQPDKHYKDEYLDLENYDRVQAVERDSSILDKDALVRKSWILGVKINGNAKAYDWRRLVSRHLINDNFHGTSLLVGIEADSLSYHVLQSNVDGKNLHFELFGDNELKDTETSSVWNWNGQCLSGPNMGKKLNEIQASQEYWHAWKYFNPSTVYSRD